MSASGKTRRSVKKGLLAALAGAATLAAMAVSVTPAAADTGAMQVPASGRVTGIMGQYCSGTPGHGGIDLAAPSGTPIYAAYSGTVGFAGAGTGSASSYGNYVTIDHPGSYRTIYAHLLSDSVSPGQKVTKGQVIGKMGSTGNSSGPHLHFEVRRNGDRQDGLNEYFKCGRNYSAGAAIGWSFPGLPSTNAPAEITPASRYLTNNNADSGGTGAFRFGTSADEHFSGDWDGDGIDTPGQRQGTKFYISRDARGTDVFTFNYGFTDSDVVVGDWDGDGKDSIGIVSSDSTWFLRNSLSGGNADLTYDYGFAGSIPVAGDWNGDGKDTPGVVSGNTWMLKNTHAGGGADLTFDYGFAGGTKLVGDWNGDGKDTPGLWRDGTWFLKNSFTGGEADATFTYGRGSDVPLVGDWNGDRKDTVGVSRNS